MPISHRGDDERPGPDGDGSAGRQPDAAAARSARSGPGAAAEPEAGTARGAALDVGRAARRVVIDPAGPVLVEGPVEVDLGDGRTAVSDRFMVAICACRRSRSFPWCDTSHRRRSRPGRDQADGRGTDVPADSGPGEGPGTR
ncbi:hypothetical protein GCM10012287_05770 [Streptomyces daqingensis]|uniref:Iron-binding zinc finger CDGSH type domain-containing protein n=1 Tax=Streptomyces daqingensis TaxID=1472640 RepID=A0ABQ2LU76_9ACTN|nr:hypothetical protein GCM10012287_05770 [Streptomyces daqingensis]